MYDLRSETDKPRRRSVIAGLFALLIAIVVSGCGGGSSSGTNTPPGLPSAQFATTVPLTTPNVGILNMTVQANGQATGTFVITNPNTGAILATVPLTGNVNVNDRTFTLTGSYTNNGQTVNVNIGGGLPAQLGGTAPITVRLSGTEFGGAIGTGIVPVPGQPGSISLVGNLTGTVYNTGSSFSYLAVGDNGANFSQAYLTFDIASLPADARITSAKLVLVQSTVQNNPFNLGKLVVEPVSFTGSLPAVTTAAPPASAVQVSSSTAIGPKQVDVTALFQSALSSGNRFQIRLRFTPGTTNNDGLDDAVIFSSGSVAVSYTQ